MLEESRYSYNYVRLFIVLLLFFLDFFYNINQLIVLLTHFSYKKYIFRGPLLFFTQGLQNPRDTHVYLNVTCANKAHIVHAVS